ncbi:hypothetical protein [Candidatus Clostridium stratigraminis]
MFGFLCLHYYTNTKDCLVFSSLFPAKPIYSFSADVKTFNLINNKLEVEYIDYGQPNGITNGIYAQNIDDITHVFVNIVKISKNDLPKGIVNIYHKK